MIAKRWELACCLKSAEKMENFEGMSELASTVLFARGFRDYQTVSEFLRVSEDCMHSPYLLKDMEKACGRIREAVENKQKILVYGDYDVDGITSTYILCDYLSSIGADCSYRIPDRVQNGYGMTKAMIDAMKADGAELIITVDNGITAAEEVDYAVSEGIGVVITDHHEFPCGANARMPAASAVVNPRRPDDSYPFKHLAGVGVAFKLVSALHGDQNKMLERYGDMLAVGTIADVMEIDGENRYFVTKGLEILAHTSNFGLDALMDVSGAKDRRINSGTINYTLAPRINAAGRLTTAENAVELFFAKDRSKAEELARELCELNCRRQKSENELYQTISTIMEEQDCVPERDKAIVLWGEGWCGGITGIVCSKLLSAYGVPVILLTIEDSVVKGSGRSIEGFNLYEALSSLSDCLDKFGGHALAAGLTMRKEKLQEFKNRFLLYAETVYKSCDIQPILRVDAEIRAKYLEVANIEGLMKLEPYGNGWNQPVFAMFGVRINAATGVGNNKHMRITLEKCGKCFNAMLFRVPPEAFPLKVNDCVDIAFTLDINLFRNEKQVQVLLQDIRPCESQGKNGIDMCRRLLDGEELSRCERTALRPERDDFVAVWRYISGLVADKIYRTGIGELALAIRKAEKRDITVAKLYICLKVLSETGLIDVTVNENRIALQGVNREVRVKIMLEESSIMQKLN